MSGASASDTWITSLERDIEVTEGQMALAKAMKGAYIGVDLKRADRIIEHLKELQLFKEVVAEMKADGSIPPEALLINKEREH